MRLNYRDITASTNNTSWDSFYQVEINNFLANPEDTGECWFDDSDAELKMIEFLISKINDNELPFKLVDNLIKIVDLGTGNGHLLFQLSEDIEEEIEDPKIKFHFHGIDYSEDSVAFAQKIKDTMYTDSDLFKFDQVNLLEKNSKFITNHEYDILLDKGTLDAIALNQEGISEIDNEIGMNVYAKQVEKMMHSQSILLITSCNFTEEELIKIVVGNTEGRLEVWEKINYPSFRFGGVQGSTICSIAFIKK